jgi:hypothetical protein
MVERRQGERRVAIIREDGDPPVNAEKSTISMKTAIGAFVGFALAFGGGVWSASGWVTSVNEHLNRMDQHLQFEDKQQELQEKQLRWLIQHSKDGNQAPMDWDSQQGQFIDPLADVSQAPQDAKNPRY